MTRQSCRTCCGVDVVTHAAHGKRGLASIGQVSNLAARAMVGMWTRGVSSMGRAFEDIDNVSSETSADVGERNAHPFTGVGVRHEDGAIRPHGEPFAATGESHDVEFDG